MHAAAASISFDSGDDEFLDRESGERLSAAAWIGCPVGARHKIVKHLGTGGMGHVFLAEHVTLGAQAAVKILGARCTPLLLDQFLAEAKLLALVNHPNVVKVFDIGEMDDDTPYMLMEHVPGIDLGEWLSRHEHLSLKRVLRILRQVAGALDHLHGQGIVHRDVKPANIMVDPDANDAVKLLDFGIAIREGTSDTGLGAGLLGTPAYMAPEQVEGSGCGKSADLYALAALALELLTGKPPYDYPSLNLVLAAVLHERPGLPSSRGIQIEGLDEVMERALAREPSARYGSALAFVDALTEVLSSRRSSAPAPSVASEKSPLAPATQPRPLIRLGLAMAGAVLAWFA
ncbi:MAG TPA: serine/threonine-protein kinase [Polyangiales bacterium]|nr:serine/threonine-protein kinase [Polyangiales bacterium]